MPFGEFIAQFQPATTDVVWLIVLLIVALMVLAGALLVLRRVLLGDRSAEGGAGLTLHELRTLHASGEMTDEEFEAARSVIVARHEARANPLTGERRASPGFDLAGDPLPGEDPQSGESEGERLSDS